MHLGPTKILGCSMCYFKGRVQGTQQYCFWADRQTTLPRTRLGVLPGHRCLIPALLSAAADRLWQAPGSACTARSTHRECSWGSAKSKLEFCSPNKAIYRSYYIFNNKPWFCFPLYLCPKREREDSHILYCLSFITAMGISLIVKNKVWFYF